MVFLGGEEKELTGLWSLDLAVYTQECNTLTNVLKDENAKNAELVSEENEQDQSHSLKFDTAVSILKSGSVIPLLAAAQLPNRTGSFQPDSSTPKDILTASDAALLLLGELATASLIFLQSRGWEVVEDDKARCHFQCPASQVAQAFPPDILLESENEESHWYLQLFAELPLLVAPYIEKEQVVWPVQVVYHSLDMAVIDVTQDEETSRQLVLGTWKGLGSFRETELDTNYKLGEHLENWYSCTLASLALFSIDTKETSRVLVVGLGGGSLCAFVKSHCRKSIISAVEISPEIAMVAKKFFLLDSEICSIDEPAETSCSIYLADAKVFAEQTDQQFDCILIDVFSNGEFPSDLMNADFFTSMQSLLPNGLGTIAINSGHGETSQIMRDILKKSLPGECISFHDPKAAGESENVVLCHGMGQLDLEKWTGVLNSLEKNESNAIMPFTIEYISKVASDVRISWGLYEGTPSNVPEKSKASAAKLPDDHSAWDLF